MDALSEIQKDGKYNDGFEFKTIDMKAPGGAEAAAKYDWEGLKHGLVILNPDGSTHTKIPGHNYEKKDIVAALDAASK